MGLGKQIFYYSLFGFAALVFFAYVLFPSDNLKQFISGKLSEMDPNIGAKIDNIRPVLPPGIALDRVDISYQGERLAQMPTLKIAPSLTTLFKTKKTISLKGSLNDGIIKGSGTLVNNNGYTFSTAYADLTNVKIEQLEYLKRLKDYRLSGLVDGKISMDDKKGPRGTITADLTLSQGRVGIVTPFFGIDHISIDRAQAALLLTSKRVRIRSCTLKGPQLDGKLSGYIDLKTPIEQSLLNLSGSAKPHPEFIARLQSTLPMGMPNSDNFNKRGLPFRITGMLGNPEFKLR